MFELSLKPGLPSFYGPPLCARLGSTVLELSSDDFLIKKTQKKGGNEHDRTPSHIVRANKFITSAAMRKESYEKIPPSWGEKNALILPTIELINSPLIMSKLSQLYLIPACRLKGKRSPG